MEVKGRGKAEREEMENSWRGVDFWKWEVDEGVE